MATQPRSVGRKPVARQLRQPPRWHQRTRPLAVNPDPVDVPHTTQRKLQVRACRISGPSPRPLKRRRAGSLRDVQQRVQLHEPEPRRDRGERLPQPPVTVRPRAGNQSSERRHTWQQHPLTSKPADCIGEDHTRTITSHVCAGSEPLLELASDHGEMPQRLGSPDLLRMLKPVCGLGAMLLGILLLLGTLSRRKQHLAVLEQDTDTGALAARPRTLREMARAMAEQARGATSVKRPKLSLSRDGTQGRLTIEATRARSTDPHALERAVLDGIGPITEPFGLKPRVRVRLGQRGTRVQ
jgi:hypothetical protein